jgi:hypothetical protein
MTPTLGNPCPSFSRLDSSSKPRLSLTVNANPAVAHPERVEIGPSDAQLPARLRSTWRQQSEDSMTNTKNHLHARGAVIVEPIERRVLLASIVVNSLADNTTLGDGLTTLREAIAAAAANSGPDVVTFANKLQGTITLTNGELAIDTDLDVNGPGAQRIAVSGNGASRIFNVIGGSDDTSAIDVSISGLKLVKGHAASGGAINQTGFVSLALADMKIRDNQAGFSGGAIQVIGSAARLDISRSTIADNRIVASDSFAFGGGVYIEEAVATVRSSTIADNRVTGLPDGGLAIGGGIASLVGDLTVSDSLIINNRVIGGAGGGEASGGGIASAFGAVLHLDDSVVKGNEARAGNGESIGQAIGGAISSAFGSHAYVSDSLLHGNRAIAGSGGFNDRGNTSIGTAFGGAIFSDTYLEVIRSTLTNNQAVGGDDATHLAPTTTDVGAAHGGAISTGFGGEAIIRDSAILNNKAIGGNNNTGSGPAGFVGTATGGGIDNAIDLAVFGDPSSPPQLTVINTTLSGNDAVGGNDNAGAGAHIVANAGLGGGIANYLGGVVDVERSLVSGNKATGGKGGLGAGGGIFNGISEIRTDSGAIALPTFAHLTQSILKLNVAQGGNPGGDGLGGGAYNDVGSTLALDICFITENRAKGAPLGGNGIGGGVYNLGTLTLDLLTVIRNNSASTSNEDVFG